MRSFVHLFTDSMTHGFMDSMIRGFMESRIHGFMDSLIHGFIDKRKPWMANVTEIEFEIQPCFILQPPASKGTTAPKNSFCD